MVAGTEYFVHETLLLALNRLLLRLGVMNVQYSKPKRHIWQRRESSDNEIPALLLRYGISNSKSQEYTIQATNMQIHVPEPRY